MSRFARYAWAVLGINLLVILWGAFVRASGSGAGCGAHWPLCDGAVIPQAPTVARMIEFTHRATSGLALLAVIWLVVWARRVAPAGTPVRRAAYASLAFILTEALIGAGLVLFEMVAQNESVARGWWMSAHLTNTFVLLAALTLTGWFASGGRVPLLRGSGGLGATISALGAGAFVLGISGAIAALGHTLFPVESLREGFAQDLSPSAHIFLRLRVGHPVIAMLFGAAVVASSRIVAHRLADSTVTRAARWLAALTVAQLAVGAANLLSLAPTALQLGHLLLADLVWIALVLFSAASLAVRPAPAVRR